MQEADTTTEWDAAAVGRFLTIHPPLSTPTSHQEPAQFDHQVDADQADNATVDADRAQFELVAKQLLDSLDTTDLQAIALALQTSPGIPREIDGKLLARARVAIRRDLVTREKREIRNIFKKILATNFVASQVLPPQH